jgi:exodeoxyribonuclease VII small subunit
MVVRMPEPSLKDFEKALAELAAIVERMESGELSLDDSLKAFERGVQLTRECQATLAGAEQRIQMLLGDGERARLKDVDGAVADRGRLPS